jgi:hypothetical protein
MSAESAASALNLSPAERAAYDELFALADGDGDGVVSVAEVAFLKKSNLDNTALSRVRENKKKGKTKKNEKKTFPPHLNPLSGVGSFL